MNWIDKVLKEADDASRREGEAELGSKKWVREWAYGHGLRTAIAYYHMQEKKDKEAPVTVEVVSDKRGPEIILDYNDGGYVYHYPMREFSDEALDLLEMIRLAYEADRKLEFKLNFVRR